MLLKRAKSNRRDLESINWEIRRAGKSGGYVYIVATFRKVTDPIDCNGGAAIHYKEVAHKMDYTSLLEGLRRGIFTKE